MNYVKTNWFGTEAAVREWNCFDLDYRTNNSTEGWHSALHKRTGGRRDLNVWDFISHLRDIHDEEYTLLSQLEAGQEVANGVNEMHTQMRNGHVLALKNIFVQNRNVLTYLFNISQSHIGKPKQAPTVTADIIEAYAPLFRDLPPPPTRFFYNDPNTIHGAMLGVIHQEHGPISFANTSLMATLPPWAANNSPPATPPPLPSSPAPSPPPPPTPSPPAATPQPLTTNNDEHVIDLTSDHQLNNNINNNHVLHQQDDEHLVDMDAEDRIAPMDAVAELELLIITNHANPTNGDVQALRRDIKFMTDHFRQYRKVTWRLPKFTDELGPDLCPKYVIAEKVLQYLLTMTAAEDFLCGVQVSVTGNSNVVDIGGVFRSYCSVLSELFRTYRNASGVPYFKGGEYLLYPNNEQEILMDSKFFKAFGRYLLLVTMHGADFPYWLHRSVLAFALGYEEGYADLYYHANDAHQFGSPIVDVMTAESPESLLSNIEATNYIGVRSSYFNVLTQQTRHSETVIQQTMEAVKQDFLLYTLRCAIHAPLSKIREGFSVLPKTLADRFTPAPMFEHCYALCTSIADVLQICRVDYMPRGDIDYVSPGTAHLVDAYKNYVLGQVSKLTDAHAANFLAWATGARKVTGLKMYLRMLACNDEDNRLPEAHTCTRTVDIHVHRYFLPNSALRVPGQHADYLWQDLTTVLEMFTADPAGFQLV